MEAGGEHLGSLSYNSAFVCVFKNFDDILNVFMLGCCENNKVKHSFNCSGT